MDRLISLQAAVDAVKSYWKAEVDAIPKDADFGTFTATCDLILKCNTEMCKVLDGIPSAQPEIIRCKECKHFAEEGMYCAWDIMVHYDHFYCYHAERRTDDERRSNQLDN